LGEKVPWFSDAFWIQSVQAPVFAASQELPSAWAKIAKSKVLGRQRKTSSGSQGSTPTTIGWGKDPAFFSGQVYVQEASSLLPVAALTDAFDAPMDDMRILDMAAAPGGKTTALCAWLANSSGAVVANEPNVARCKVLVENLLRTGSMPKAAVTQMDGRQCGKCWPGYFDAVLLDAPCSGESLTRREGLEMLEHPAGYVDGLSKLQRQLIRSAFESLKVGGVLVYSTCTLNVQENEHVCSFLEETFPGAVERETIHLPGTEKMRTPQGCLRCWPQMSDTQGFFVARFRKTAELKAEAMPKGDGKVLERLGDREVQMVERAFRSAFDVFPSENFELRRSAGELWLCPKVLGDLGFFGPRRCGIRLAVKRRQELNYPAHIEWVLSYGHLLSDDSFGVANLDRAAALAFCAGEDVEPLWTPAAAVAEAGAQAVVKYDDLVLGLGRWGLSRGLRNDVPTQWRCRDLAL